MTMTARTYSCSNLLNAVTAKRVTVRSWRLSDTSEINALFNDPTVRPDAAGPHDAVRTQRQWEWEFAALTPDDPAYFIAEQAGRIVGLQGYIPIDLLYNGQPVRSGKDEDTLVHPDHRGRGVLDSLYRRLFDRAASDGVAALWGFTSTAVKPLLRNGYRSLGTFDAMRLPLSPPSEPMNGPNAEPPLADIEIGTLVQPDQRCDTFSREFGEYAGGITLHLSEAYLRWRILENPYRRHAIVAAQRGHKIVGLGIFKLDDPQRVGYVSDLVALPTETHTAEAILSVMLREGLVLFRKSGLRTAESRFSGGHHFNVRVRGVLAQWGFKSIPSSQSAKFLVRTIQNESNDWLHLDHWRICELMREY